MSTPITGVGTTPAAAGITGIQNSIQKIAAPVRSDQEEQAVGLDELKESSSFGSLFGELIQNVKDTDAEFTQAQYLLSTGQLDNPAQVNLAGYKAELSLSLLIELRNRALEAYNELKNMNV